MNRLDASKIIYNADRLVDISREGDTYPVHMQIGLTDYCNHKCVFCYTDAVTGDFNKVNNIEKETLLSFLAEAEKCGLKAVTLIGTGEPLLHPDVVDILYGIKKIGLDIGIYTNGSKLDGKIADAVLDTCTFVRVSINAASEEEHNRVHRVKNQFNNIVNNIKELVDKRNSRKMTFPTIGTQFVFFMENVNSIKKAAELWRNVGVDYFAIKPLIDGEGNSVNETVFQTDDVNNIVDQMKLAKEYETDNYKVYAKYEQFKRTGKDERSYSICYGHSIDANLLADGNMTICCNLFGEKDIIGSIYEMSFQEIWKGDRRKRVIKSINLNRCPKACRCDPLNETIWDVLHPDMTVHPNFV